MKGIPLRNLLIERGSISCSTLWVEWSGFYIVFYTLGWVIGVLCRVLHSQLVIGVLCSFLHSGLNGWGSMSLCALCALGLVIGVLCRFLHSSLSDWGSKSCSALWVELLGFYVVFYTLSWVIGVLCRILHSKLSDSIQFNTVTSIAPKSSEIRAQRRRIQI